MGSRPAQMSTTAIFHKPVIFLASTPAGPHNEMDIYNFSFIQALRAAAAKNARLRARPLLPRGSVEVGHIHILKRSENLKPRLAEAGKRRGKQVETIGQHQTKISVGWT